MAANVMSTAVLGLVAAWTSPATGPPVVGKRVLRSFSAGPICASDRAPAVPLSLSAFSTVEGEALGNLPSRIAAAPVTWGAAIEVPLSVQMAVFETREAETMFEAGAQMSTAGP